MDTVAFKPTYFIWNSLGAEVTVAGGPQTNILLSTWRYYQGDTIIPRH